MKRLDELLNHNLRTADTTSNGSGPIAELNFDYAYLADKNVQSENTLGGFLAASSFTASYDAGNRLINWNRTGTVGNATRQTEAWAYDDTGNQINVTRDGTAQARTYNADDELTGIDGDATQLDAKGNMTEDADGNKYFYDLDNRINRIEMASTAAIIEFQYDAMSRRVLRKQGVNEVAYLWWGDQETSEHVSGAGQPVIQNDLWAHPTALNKICARALEGDKDEIQYYHKNYLDHVYAVSDDNGNLLEHYRYTAFGEVEIFDANTQNKLAGSAIGNPVLWNSRRFDEQSGLYYYKYRHYKADIGRWLGRDPIEEAGGINLYGFCKNLPFNCYDKYGEAPILIPIGIWGWRAYRAYRAYQKARRLAEAFAKKGNKAKAKAKVEADCAKNIKVRGSNCTAKRLGDLQRAVVKACKTNVRNCDGVTDCQTARKRSNRNDACVKARGKVSKECFGGLDEGHEQALMDAVKAHLKCIHAVAKYCR